MNVRHTLYFNKCIYFFLVFVDYLLSIVPRVVDGHCIRAFVTDIGSNNLFLCAFKVTQKRYLIVTSCQFFVYKKKIITISI